VKLSVVSGSGKEAVVAMFGPGDFFGEGCMAGPALPMGTTTAATQSTLLAIQKEQLLGALHAEHELSDHFIAYMLAHNIRVEEDLINSSTAAKNAWHGRCCFWHATERPTSP
jgi:CRP-like cAMP-binding protein